MWGPRVGQRLRADGRRLGKSFRISGANATVWEDYPAVAHNSVDNEYVVVWQDERDEATREDDIFGQRIAGDGTKVGSNFRITGVNAVAGGGSPFWIGKSQTQIDKAALDVAAGRYLLAITRYKLAWIYAGIAL